MVLRIANCNDTKVPEPRRLWQGPPDWADSLLRSSFPDNELLLFTAGLTHRISEESLQCLWAHACS